MMALQTNIDRPLKPSGIYEFVYPMRKRIQYACYTQLNRIIFLLLREKQLARQAVGGRLWGGLDAIKFIHRVFRKTSCNVVQSEGAELIFLSGLNLSKECIHLHGFSKSKSNWNLLLHTSLEIISKTMYVF